MSLWYLALAYFLLWMFTWPALLADLQHSGDIGKDGDVEFSQEKYTKDLIFCLILSLIPMTWLVVPFISGFFKHGFQISRRVK